MYLYGAFMWVCVSVAVAIIVSRQVISTIFTIPFIRFRLDKRFSAAMKMWDFCFLFCAILFKIEPVESTFILAYFSRTLFTLLPSFNRKQLVHIVCEHNSCKCFCWLMRLFVPSWNVTCARRRTKCEFIFVFYTLPLFCFLTFLFFGSSEKWNDLEFSFSFFVLTILLLNLFIRFILRSEDPRTIQ